MICPRASFRNKTLVFVTFGFVYHAIIRKTGQVEPLQIIYVFDCNKSIEFARSEKIADQYLEVYLIALASQLRFIN